MEESGEDSSRVQLFSTAFCPGKKLHTFMHMQTKKVNPTVNLIVRKDPLRVVCQVFIVLYYSLLYYNLSIKW